MSAEDRYQFEDVSILSPFAIGVPGKRTFFLAVGQKDNWVRVWMEKDLLEVLGSAVDQFLVSLSREEHVDVSQGAVDKSPSAEAPSGLPAGEFEIDEVALGYEEGKAVLNLVVHSAGLDKENRVEIEGTATLGQIKQLSVQSKKVCAAGRPLCPLCGSPIGPSGHNCPKNN
jgi:uncharacterized repeat protein (TIGR03847 family)